MVKKNKKNKNIMVKKISTLIVIVLYSFQILAQSPFSIKITQVYPAGSVVYGNVYNLSGELDKAEQKLRSQYNGKSANYIMELTRPSGKETKYIQNIYWILSENGKKTNHKNKPTLKEYYHESTIVEYYACDIYGKQKSNSPPKKIEYDHYYCFFKGGLQFYKVNDTIIYKFDDCFKRAKEYFTANTVNTFLCIAKIYNSKGIAIDSIDNIKEYNQYITDSIKAVENAKIKKQEELRVDSIEKTNKPVYNNQNMEKQLKQLQIKVDSLKKGSDNYRKNINSIIDEAEKIVLILDLDVATFDKNKYFGTLDKKDLRE
jgi:hypothetical protein